MKKLIMMAVVAAIASVTNAASFKWYSANNTMKTSAGAGLDVGSTFYVLNLTGSSASAFTTAFQKAHGDISSESLSSYVIGSQNVTAQYAKVGDADSPAVNGSDSFTALQSYDIALLYIDALTKTGDDKTGSVKIQISQTKSMKTYDPTDPDQAASAAVYKFTSSAGQTGYVTASWSDVPEPTSGLLLLVGMVGLALRRHRI